MPVAEVRPGMVGVGRTVFDGTRVEEFKAHILGVIENVIGPQRNLILARLEGGPLADTGVIAGMSGSPVYIDGRLIGAVSYSLGSFSKEPIAGITPIDEMIDATALEHAAPGRRPRQRRVPAHRATTLVAAFRKALNWNRPFADRAGRRQRARRRRGIAGLRRPRGRHACCGRSPRRSSCRASTPDCRRRCSASPFREQGFVPMGGGGGRARDGD